MWHEVDCQSDFPECFDHKEYFKHQARFSGYALIVCVPVWVIVLIFTGLPF